MTGASVTILVVNWNGRDLLEDCLDSAFRQDHDGGVDVLVVDNGSTDGSPEFIEAQYPAVRVLRNQDNNYAAANNLGVRSCESEFVLLLNSDASLGPDCLRILLSAMEARPDVAGSAPKVLYPDGRLYTTGIQETEDLYWFDRDQGKPDPGDADPEEVPGISGCCALFRRNMWLQAGGEDEDFHMYYEDVDFCLRLRSLGFRFLYVPRARATHIGHASIEKSPHSREELGDRNRLLILASHYPDRFVSLAASSSWFRTAPSPLVLDTLRKLSQRLGVSESQLTLQLTQAMRSRHALRRWSLRRRMQKIWKGLRRHLSRSQGAPNRL